MEEVQRRPLESVSPWPREPWPVPMRDLREQGLLEKLDEHQPHMQLHVRETVRSERLLEELLTSPEAPLKPHEVLLRQRQVVQARPLRPLDHLPHQGAVLRVVPWLPVCRVPPERRTVQLADQEQHETPQQTHLDVL